MPAAKTFYEVLGVKRTAHAQDIERAYFRLREKIQRDDDARRAAVVKVAYATLSDPQSRAEYDASLAEPRHPVRVIDLFIGAAGLLLVGIVLWIGYRYFFAGPASAPPARTIVDAPRLLQDVGRHVSRMQAALVSGEVRDLGLAVEIGEGRMAASCRELSPGTALTVRQGSTVLRAEALSAPSPTQPCVLEVQGVRSGVALRPTAPTAEDKLYAIVRGDGAPEIQPVTFNGVVQAPTGAAFTLRAKAALPNGTPVFDGHEALVGLVLEPQALAPGATLVMPASRIAEGARP